MKWTAEQLAGITTTGKSVLVSAAAGSGKTAVLAERCAHLVCDAADKCSVDELLVVTFTKAAADQMRARIEDALRKRLEQTDDDRLARQLQLLAQAQISTLHGFCSAVLRQHFSTVGLDPNFRVLDEEETALLRTEIARDLLDDHYETDTGGQFQRFVDLYGNGNDQFVSRQVIHLHELMCSVVDPQAWLDRAAANITEAANAQSLAKSFLGAQLVRIITDWLGDLQRRWVQLAGQISQVGGLHSYGEYVNNLLAAVQVWSEEFGKGNFDALSAAAKEFDPGRLPGIRQAPPQKETIQAAITAVREDMQRGSVVDMCRFTEQQWRDGLNNVAEPAGVLIGLVREFGERYEQAKSELRGLDFADLERFALRVLRADPVAAAYRQRFKHVLVDEYQDINAVQDTILHLVSREAQGDVPGNLFCVGDVKQSIYRFRLAEPRQFLGRYAEFKRASAPPLPSGEGRGEGVRENQMRSTFEAALTLTLSRRERGQAIDLRSNFRSRGPLLNVINGLFERLMTYAAAEIEYDESHRLRAGAEFPAAPAEGNCFSGAPVELHLLPAEKRGGEDQPQSEELLELDRTQREAAFVARRVAELVGKPMHVAAKSPDGTTTLRPIRYRDIVVLLRSMKYKSESFAELLRTAGIPVHSDSSTGFFDSTEIRDMVSLLKVLDNQRQDVPLAALLRSPLAELDHADDALARIRLAYPDAQAVPFHVAVVHYAAEQEDELSQRLGVFLKHLGEWREMAHQRPLAEVIWQILHETAYVAFCSGMEDGQQRVANLIDFHERARQFGTFQRQGLSRFMEFLDQLAEETELGQPSVASEADDVVRVMSIHRAKGLEFPVVIVPDLGKRHNLQDSAGSILTDRDTGIGLMVADQRLRVRYPSLAYVVVQDRIRRQSLAEELRVLYVAMTRAKEHLILVGTCADDACEKWQTQWAQHAGPLPAQQVLRGLTMLDWIGPAAAALKGSGAEHCVEVTSHGEDEVATWSIATQRRKKFSDRQRQLARLEPLEPPPPMHADALSLVEHLMRPYAHQAMTQVPAVQSVAGLTKHGRWAAGGASESHAPVVEFEKELPPPRCVLRETKPSATDIGSATHLVLQHLDFSRACDAADVRMQIEQLVSKRLLPAAMAQVVDVEAIAWFAGTELGQVLRRNGKSLRRELPIYYPQDSGGDELDRVMVRGRVDVLVVDGEKIVLVDYKTDRVTAQTVEARAEFYRPQMVSYRDALAAITGKRVAANLVFLAARAVRQMNDE